MKKRFQPYMIKTIENMTADGKTVEEIAAKLNVDKLTIFNWSKKYEGVKKALHKGREFQAHQVVQSLFRRAVGYDYEESKQVKVVDANGGIKSIKYERAAKHVAADVGAAIFLLKNLMPDKFRDKWDIEQTGNFNMNIKYDKSAIIDLFPEEINKNSKQIENDGTNNPQTT
ncbi:MAG: hypothetical protein LBF88_09105 [Planctomycetaceae bacterium]|jgi:hypothetical protein|nr:hypothetical protein [Planctomycetaceae bacterium]